MRLTLLFLFAILISCADGEQPRLDYTGYEVVSSIDVTVTEDGAVLTCNHVNESIDEVNASGTGNSIDIDEDGIIDLYLYNSAPDNYTRDIRKELTDGCNSWQTVTGKGIRARITDDLNSADITIEFDSTNKYNTFQSITLATMSTYKATWGKPARMLVNTKFDLNLQPISKLFAHEIGHALGMNSKNGRSHVETTVENRVCVMYPAIRDNGITICQVTTDQIQEVQAEAIARHGELIPPVVPTPDPEPEPEPMPEPEEPKELDAFTYGLLIAFRIEYETDAEFLLYGGRTVKSWGLIFGVENARDSKGMGYKQEVLAKINELRKLIKE